MLSRVILGARVTIPLAVLLVFLAMTIGATAGAVAGYFAGAVDGTIMRLSDLVFAFPPIILAMAVVASLGPGLRNAVLAMVIVAWPSYARVVRSLVLTFRGREFVAASRLLGASNRRALVVDVMPNVYGPVLVLATLELGNALLLLAGLSFLGLGARPPSPEWGAMVADGARTFDRWWIAMFPGLAILTVVIAFNFLGDSLRDALDPRTSRAHDRATTSAIDDRERRCSEIEDLRILLRSGNSEVALVDGVSLTVAPGSVVGLAGESGQWQDAHRPVGDGLPARPVAGHRRGALRRRRTS